MERASFVLAIILIIFDKMLLICGNEIVAISNDPINYVRRARDYLGKVGGPNEVEAPPSL